MRSLMLGFDAAGARRTLVSMAAAGAVLVAEDKLVYETDAPKGILVNGVGAGDSMVAGFLAGWMEKKEYRHAFAMGVSAGSASAFSERLAEKKRVMICIGENLRLRTFFGEKICRPCTKEHKYPCTWPAGLFFV